MKKIWRGSNRGVLIGALCAMLAGLLLAYGYLRDQAPVIDSSYYTMLQKNDYINSASIEGEYVYLKTQDRTYKIAKDAIDIKELAQNTPLEVRGDGIGLEQTVDVILLTVMLLFLIALFSNMKKQQQERDRREKEKDHHAGSAVGFDDFSTRIYPMVSHVTFKDVAGITEVKEELEEVIDFLKNPRKYKTFGVRLPRGVLLIGPPGVGKTMIAKAVAGEAGVPFFYQSGSAFVQIYVGMGAKRVRELFSRAKATSPSIVFIDEIDAVGKARGGYRNDERETTLNQLLTEMDGFEESSGIIVIGATNKIDMLDEALLRSGRFDRRVFVGLPTFPERQEIFNVYLKGKPCSCDLEALARMTVGFSGAGIASLVNEAAITALKRGSKEIELRDFHAVKDKVLLGKQKKMSYSDEEKKLLATYQAAKAIAAYWYEIDFDKFSLMSDGLKDVDREIVSKSELFNKIKVFLAGPAALELKYNERFSNNREDLMKARMIALEMVEQYGMGDRLMGDHSDALQILQEAMDDMKSFIGGLNGALGRVETVLLEHETITREELKEQLGDFL